jgi:molybdenum-dependent DNA-binding transcriptional regulator ModE
MFLEHILFHPGWASPRDAPNSKTMKKVPTSNSNLHSSRPSPRQEAPFIWSSRKALERISRLGNMQGCLASQVYLALCRLSSEQQNTSAITASISVVATLAGLRYRKTWELLHQLQDEAKVIRIERNGGIKSGPKESNTYYILPLAGEANRSAPNADRSVKNLTQSMQTVLKESEAFHEKKKVKNKSAASSDSSLLAGSMPDGRTRSRVAKKGLGEEAKAKLTSHSEIGGTGESSTLESNSPGTSVNMGWEIVYQRSDEVPQGKGDL